MSGGSEFHAAIEQVLEWRIALKWYDSTTLCTYLDSEELCSVGWSTRMESQAFGNLEQVAHAFLYVVS